MDLLTLRCETAETGAPSTPGLVIPRRKLFHTLSGNLPVFFCGVIFLDRNVLPRLSGSDLSASAITLRRDSSAAARSWRPSPSPSLAQLPVGFDLSMTTSYAYIVRAGRSDWPLACLIALLEDGIVLLPIHCPVAAIGDGNMCTASHEDGIVSPESFRRTGLIGFQRADQYVVDQSHLPEEWSVEMLKTAVPFLFSTEGFGSLTARPQEEAACLETFSAINSRFVTAYPALLGIGHGGKAMPAPILVDY
ncbi:hypothetical protein QBC42DRAFT_349800 [Cladorrhinum samala]|uniref:Uncharacterized protein n=1 Tax=Cladorrhinum samala TaxID=585594 RepID=A0AAV9HEC2_9PEZI|nr:hypothetical protein QBC42DRAFT_349800 [Cladorrhinum samala]